MSAESVTEGGYTEVVVTGPDGSQITVPVTLTAKGVYEATFIVRPEAGVGMVTIEPKPVKPKAPPRRKENSEYFGFVKRSLRGYAVRIGEQGDPDDLPAMVSLADAFEQALAQAVQALNDRGFSWQSIGDAVGMRRQHAWRRWHRREGDSESD